MLFTRIVTMYGVVAVVNLITRFERIRRIEAVERERELQRERIETSQTIHDTVAQSAYLMGLGLETAMELAKLPQRRKPRRVCLPSYRPLTPFPRRPCGRLRHPIDAGLYSRAGSWAGC